MIFLFSCSSFASEVKVPVTDWKNKIAAELEGSAEGEGRLGVYVRDMSSGESYSLGGEETWYLASGVKVPVAIELLRQVEAGKLSLQDTITLRASDFIDGSGETNYQKPGTKLSLLYLLEQMIIHSDNTASDLLIQKVGLRNVNATVARLVKDGFHEITTLSDVRRHAYSGIHPFAMRLKNRELMQLKKEQDEKKRVRKLASILKVPEERTEGKTVQGAFSAYYARHLNSASLVAYSNLLELLVKGEAIGPEGTALLLEIMQRVETGKQRISAGLNKDLVWAHKTGTQYARVCDFGIIWPRKAPAKKVLVSTCASGFSSVEKAEAELKRVGEVLASSGVFTVHP